MLDHRRKRFTLIELLVVVAIIAILASLLLPALTTARNKARDGACLNNLKQQGAAAGIYASEYEDYPLSPHCYDLRMSAHKTLVDLDLVPWEVQYYPRGTSSPAGVRESPIMVCPRLKVQLNIYGPGSHNYVMSHYSNTWLNGYSRYNASTDTHTYSLGLHNNRSGPYKQGAIRYPDTTVLLSDAVVLTYAPGESHAYKTWGYEGYISSQTGMGNDRTLGNQQTWSGTWRYGRLTHDSGPNVLFWDLHASLYRYHQIGRHPMMPNAMLTANGSGNTQPYGGTPYVP